MFEICYEFHLLANANYSKTFAYIKRHINDCNFSENNAKSARAVSILFVEIKIPLPYSLVFVNSSNIIPFIMIKTYLAKIGYRAYNAFHHGIHGFMGNLRSDRKILKKHRKLFQLK